LTPYQKHVEKWRNCTLCEACQHRKNVALVRGSIPSQVLFIGEAPGPSEDVLGRPFVGPAGKLLDQIIREAWVELDEEPTWAFTNLVACIPLDDNQQKFAEPSESSIKACSERLAECVRLCRPRAIVLVGQLAQKRYDPKDVRSVSIVHPAAILRADESQRGLAVKRCVITLRQLIEDLNAPF
jgi:DNA polymerase